MGTVERCSRCQGYGCIPTSSSTLYPDIRLCRYCAGRGQRMFEDVDDIGAVAERRFRSPATGAEGDERGA